MLVLVKGGICDVGYRDGIIWLDILTKFQEN
jgi:hypothetical protein